MPLPFRSPMRFGRDSFLRSPANIQFAQVSQVVYVRVEGPKTLSPEQWIASHSNVFGRELAHLYIVLVHLFHLSIVNILCRLQAARPEGPKALSPRQWIQAARPERAEALSPGQRPGLFGAVTCRPVRAKALKLLAIFKAFALTGRIADCHCTQGAALG
mgnify:CR=1 FL=1